MLGGIYMAQKENFIVTDRLIIDKNSISFDTSIVQISNISSIEIKSPSKKEVSFWAIQILIVGALLLWFGLTKDNEYCAVVGGILMLSFIIYVIWIEYENSDKGERYLFLFLNSGYIYSIYCDDPKFLRRVIGVLRDCMNNRLFGQRIKIDFENCSINNSTISPRNETMTDHRRNFSNNGNIISGQDFWGNNFNVNSNNATNSYNANSFNTEYLSEDDELHLILKDIMDNLFELNDSDRDNLQDIMQDVESEFQTSNLNSERLRNLTTEIARYITIANGIPVLANNLQQLINYICKYL